MDRDNDTVRVLTYEETKTDRTVIPEFVRAK